jgi:hypothetical protein
MSWSRAARTARAASIVISHASMCAIETCDAGTATRNVIDSSAAR